MVQCLLWEVDSYCLSITAVPVAISENTGRCKLRAVLGSCWLVGTNPWPLSLHLSPSQLPVNWWQQTVVPLPQNSTPYDERPAFMEPEGSFHTNLPIYLRSILILSFHLCIGATFHKHTEWVCHFWKVSTSETEKDWYNDTPVTHQTSEYPAYWHPTSFLLRSPPSMLTQTKL
jgi:hypothetical protein